MNKKSDFDRGFDQGFNAGYDLGYEKSYEESLIQNSMNNSFLTNSLLTKELFHNIVLTIDRERFIVLFKKFASDISITPLCHSKIFANIKKSLQSTKSYTILSTCDLFDVDNNLCEVKDIKNVITALKNTDILLLPSLLESEKMFCINSFLYNNNVFTDIGLKSVVSDLFTSLILRKLNNLSDFIVFDCSAPHICNYLNDTGIKARPANDSAYNTKICLIGKIAFKWNIIESLQVNKNIIIDIQEIRTRLINRVLPIGVNNYKKG